jgi:hypothetical protein
MSCIAGRRFILSSTTAVFIVICSPPIYAQVPLWKVTKAGHEVVIEGYARFIASRKGFGLSRRNHDNLPASKCPDQA